ncbi:MAG: putative glycoside hydrolase [Patescibacteria group bacterium]
MIIWIFSIFCFNIILFLINSTYFEGNYLNQSHRLIKKVSHLQKPDKVKGIYITAYTAGTGKFDELISFIKKEGLNTAVVDAKGPNGEPAFFLERESLKKYNVGKPLYNPEEIVEKLHKENIYAIARVFVFQDPFLVEQEPQFALQKISGGFWADRKGVKWLDPTHFGVWKYTADFAREAYERGFDEVQFDYIRFPSDGNLATIKYSGWDGKTAKEFEIEKFFIYISRVLRGLKIPISADLFGLVCCTQNYDLGIGQKLERALPYFDYISPMMYPSHYSAGTQGFQNPAAHPYEIVKYSMAEANKKIGALAAATSTPLALLRPWIQDFDIGDNYDTAKILAQIRAAEEEYAEGFLIWNARNVYTPLTK